MRVSTLSPVVDKKRTIIIGLYVSILKKPGYYVFKLTYNQFQLLWLSLSKKNLLKGIPLAIKEASILKEM